MKTVFTQSSALSPRYLLPGYSLLHIIPYTPAMPSPTDFPARGKIIEVRDSIVIFQPSTTNYQLHLEFTGDTKPQVSAQPIECFIRVEARKVYTVPSG